MPVEGDPPVWPEAFVGSAEDRRAVLVLMALRGITPRRMIEVASERGTAAATLAWIRRGRAGSAQDRAFARSIDPDVLEAATRACGARLVAWGSPEYPWQLRDLHDPPVALFVIGAPPPEITGAVAVVGARRSTAAGRESASAIGRGLAAAGVCVVSGAARGIDSAAHEGALEAGGPTLAVLGCGLDVADAVGSRALVARVARAGTLVSEYPPGTPAFPKHFPARNRIVAGLCAATVVVEGARGSGSMITAEHAMELGRDVYAVPGPVASALSEVPLQLIRDGARMIRGPEDLLEDLGVEAAPSLFDERLRLDDAERRALDALVEPTLAERLATRLGTSVPEIVGVLMRLELRGLVRNVGGRYEPTLRARPQRAAANGR